MIDLFLLVIVMWPRLTALSTSLKTLKRNLANEIWQNGKLPQTDLILQMMTSVSLGHVINVCGFMFTFAHFITTNLDMMVEPYILSSL